MKRINITAIILLLFLSSLSWAQEAVPKSKALKRNSLGLGAGIPYGILGGNLDLNVISNLNLSAGIGTTVIAGIGYSVGFKYFFNSVAHKFRPRVSAYYGVNSGLVKEYNCSWMDDETEIYTGLSLGVGAQYMWGKRMLNGFDFDIIFVATTGFDADELRREGFVVEDPSRVKVSLGYRRAF